jgi:hypothetical protein
MPVKPGSKTKDPRLSESGEDRSIAHDMDRKKETRYPRDGERERQMDNQPEFIEKEPNRKDKEQE